MKKQKVITIAIILIAILLMAVGYAALTATSLTINGTATAVTDQNNFKVHFTGETKSTSGNKVATTVAAKATTATVNITGLTTKDEVGYAILEIINESTDINADSVEVTAQNTDTDYIDISAIMCDENGDAVSDTAIAVGEKIYVKVSAQLKETLNADVQTSIAVTLTATPDTTNN